MISQLYDAYAIVYLLCIKGRLLKKQQQKNFSTTQNTLTQKLCFPLFLEISYKKNVERHLEHSKKTQRICLALLFILLSILLYFVLPSSMTEASKRVCSILLFAILFWGFEIIPLFATSLIIVLLLTLFLTAPANLLGVGSGVQFFLTPFSSPIIMLFFGGLTLAAAAHTHHVDIYLIEKMLSKLGHSALSLIIGLLFITAFFSMWISNTAAAALMLMLIKPILDQFGKSDLIKQRMVLAIAFGANIGGIATPIGTPPNAIALGILREFGININFLEWMAITLPLMLVLLAITALVLTWLFPTKIKQIPFDISQKSTISKNGKTVLYFALIIIVLWLTEPLHHIPESMVALGGVCLLATFGLISKKEIRSIPWEVLILMWGGLALGEAVQKSGLIGTIVSLPFFQQRELIVIIAFSVVALILTSFISNTATANILLPIAINVDPSHKAYIAITVALACSFSFAFPISTPPNALAYGTGLFSIKDMMKSGALISVIGLVIMLPLIAYIIPLILNF